MSVVHKLKADPLTFDAVWTGVKTHEIRLNDRNFRVGDELHLAETKWSSEMMKYRPDFYPLIYTDRLIVASITHIQTGYGLNRDWVILSLKVELRQPQ